MQAPYEMLLIEDDAVTREVLSLLLANDGWKVVSAEDGEAALALLERAVPLPSLVLCDQNLPGICGSRLADTVRQVFESAGETPVLLAMTATRGSTCSGYDGTLIKPFTPLDLRHAFEAVAHKAEEKQKAEIATTQGDDPLPALPVIDEGVFLNLKSSMGERPVRELYAFATADATTRLTRMKASQTDIDLPKLTSEAHMLKGAAGMIGARRLALLASEIETLCATGDADHEMLAAKLVMVAAALADIPLMLETLFSVRP